MFLVSVAEHRVETKSGVTKKLGEDQHWNCLCGVVDEPESVLPR
jgi:hypothetical protein